MICTAKLLGALDTTILEAWAIRCGFHSLLSRLEMSMKYLVHPDDLDAEL